MSNVFIMLIGLPGVGKSHVRSKVLKEMEWNNNVIIISSDDYIEEEARIQGKTYNDIFVDVVKTAESVTRSRASLAFKARRDVIWDQTNLSVKSRAAKLAMVPEGYKKIAYVILPPSEEEHQRRLDSRKGKLIPPGVIEHMKSQYEPPTTAEGFDEAVFIIN